MDRDRHVTDWVQSGKLHGVWGAGVMGIWVFVALMAGFPMPLREYPLLLVPLALGLGYAAGRGLGGLILGSSGDAAQQVYMPGASGTYIPQHSHIDTMEAKGDYAGAADAWDRLAIAHPRNAWPLIRAGELYMRQLKDPDTALHRFMAARDLPGIPPEPHMYASQKLIDLYLGPLDDRGRALVELRRFVHTHAGTREAGLAREAIARLKAESGGDPTPP